MKHEIRCAVTPADRLTVSDIDDDGDAEFDMTGGDKCVYVRYGEDLDALIKHLKKQRKKHRKRLERKKQEDS